jgi:radical SAM protein with 4Fe4S-binding SPASM domain
MESLNYSKFSQGIQSRLIHQRVPLCAAIEVTRRCPLECAHCYNNLPIADHEARAGELTYDEHRRILDEIVASGCLWLLYTGGEIFARPDFLDIYTYAKQKGLLITLFTNGTLITPKIADYLAEWRPFSTEITLYGRTQETYEHVTGVKGSYELCMRAIRLLKERGLPVKLKTMAIAPNKHELWDMKRFVEEELRLEFRFDAMINPRIDPSPKPLAVRLTPEEVVALDLKDPKRMVEWGKFCAQFNGQPPTPEHLGELYQCGGGVNSFAVDPYGKMSICVLSHKDGYDLRTGSFREGWEHFLAEVRQKKSRKQTKCLSCEVKAMCGMCPANGELENRDPEEPIDFMCQVAHLRARALGLAIKPHGECEYCKLSRLE